MDSPNNSNDEIEYMGTRSSQQQQQSDLSTPSRDIKGVQLIAEPELTQDAFGRTTAVNQDVYWRQDTTTVKVGRAPQSISARPSVGSFRRAFNAPDSFVLSCPVMSRDHARFTLEGNQVFIVDIGSHHGTWRVNPGSEPTHIVAGKRTLVLDGDCFKFGKVVSKANQTHDPAIVTVRFIYDDTAHSPHTESYMSAGYAPNRFDLNDDMSSVTSDVSDTGAVHFSSEYLDRPHIIIFDDEISHEERQQSVLSLSSMSQSPIASPREIPEEIPFSLPDFESSFGNTSTREVFGPMDEVIQEMGVVEAAAPAPAVVESPVMNSESPPEDSPLVSQEATSIEHADKLWPELHKLKTLQNDLQKLKIFRKKAKNRIDHNHTFMENKLLGVEDLLESNNTRIQRLENKVAGILSEAREQGLADVNQVSNGCDDLMNDVKDLRTEVSGGRLSVDVLLSELKELAAKTQGLIKAELEEVRRARESEEIAMLEKTSRKRSIDEVDVSDDANTVVAHSDSTSIDNQPKRARIEIVIPPAAGVLAGVVAGSLLTWAGLAFA